MSRSGAIRSAWWLLVVILVAASAGLVVLGGGQMSEKNHAPPPVADNREALQTALSAARTATEKILTYTAETVEQDVNAAKAYLTGEFLAYYGNFVNQTVIPAAHANDISTRATVVRAGVQSLTIQNASLLLFVNQTTTTQAKPRPENTSSAVRVELVKVHDSCLINKFDPV